MRKIQNVALVREASGEKHMVVSTEYGTIFDVSVYDNDEFAEKGEQAACIEWHRANNKDELDATYAYLCTKYGVVIQSTVWMSDSQ